MGVGNEVRNFYLIFENMPMTGKRETKTFYNHGHSTEVSGSNCSMASFLVPCQLIMTRFSRPEELCSPGFLSCSCFGTCTLYQYLLSSIRLIIRSLRPIKSFFFVSTPHYPNFRFVILIPCRDFF